ncbi:MAG: SDR family NAD(P)-dependent oxidoreductase [Geobacteraceae bacterium]|nr:SDR family NAD(P)-dependent oxidoreductase [Geobacteraceae bacterium]
MSVRSDNQAVAEGKDRLAIIGIGCLFPKAAEKSAYWANIREGVDAISEIPTTHWNPADYYNADQKKPDFTYGQRGGFLDPLQFNPMEYNIPPNTLEAIDTSQLLGMVAAGQALTDAGYGTDKQFDRSRTSVILGVTGTLELVIPLGARLGHPIWRNALKDAGVDDTTAEDVVQRISDSYVPWQENSFPGLLGNVVAGRISKQFDLGGTNCVVDAACASSFSALHLAGLELLSGKSDMVVTGGIDTFNDIFMYMCFSKTPALSPSGNAKPFDANGDGTILGEGLGVVVLKRLSDAERDGDRIYAVIRGIGSSSDGKGDAIYAPSSQGQKRALLDAYSIAGTDPQSIGLIEAHGTGTKVGDAVEVSALRDVYGESDLPWCALGSVKSQIGHTKASAGAAGLIKAAMALHYKVIPPTIKVTKPLDEVTRGNTPFYISTEKRPWLTRDGMPRRAAVSAFGFGGSNFHTVLEEYSPKRVATDWDGKVQIIPFTADDAKGIETALSTLPTAAPWLDLRSFAHNARKCFDASANCRLILVAEDGKSDLPALAAKALSLLKSSPAGSWSTPDGICYSAEKPAGRTAALFPGQGSQYCGMLRDLACAFPQLTDSLAAADDGFEHSSNRLLSELIYPLSDFTDGAATRNEESLRATDCAQPAIGAVSIGALRLLESFGFTAEAAAGHSYGELTALCAGGRIDEAALHSLSRLRGKLMAGDGGDRGSMLAVSAPLATVEAIIAEERLDLVIANKNAPSQAVLSGATAEIERGAAIMAARGVTAKKLPVAAAFHSPLVAGAAEPFLAALANITINPGSTPVYANSSAAIYPSAEADARQLLAGQLASAVEFVAEIEAMYADGVRTFVEIGPGARLTGLVKSILGEREFLSVAIDASNGKKSGIVDLAKALAQLVASGQTLHLAKWDEDFIPPKKSAKPAMTIPLCGANYVTPRQKRAPSPVKQVVSSQGPVVSSQPGAAPVSRDALAESLRVTRESMALLQKMQEDTAKLHRQFLDGQERAARTFQTLLESQQMVLAGGVAAALPVYEPVRFEPAPTAASSFTPAAVPTAAPVSAPAPVASSAPAVDTSAVLLAVVSEKTGYPVEMLDLSMGLDADLGIDSIKRVEILSAVQEKLPGAPVIGPEHLGTLNTLGEIAAFLGTGGVAVTSAAPVAASAPAVDTAATLLAVVSEKTGYPTEMLDLSMGLDADLGIDSIKRVEILSAVQEKLPGAPVIGPEHLGTLNTLGEIAAFLGQGAAVASSPVTAVATADTASVLLAVVSEKTGYPTEMLDLSMGLDADLGIDSIKRVEILSAVQERLPQAPVIGPEHLGTLNTLGEIANFLGNGQSSEPATAAAPVSVATAAVVAETVIPTAKAAPINRRALIHQPLGSTGREQLALADGELLITDDGSPFVAELYSQLSNRGAKPRLIQVDEEDAFASARISGLVIIAPQSGCDDVFLEESFLLLKRAASTLRHSGEDGGALFATISRLDGAFGSLEGSTLADPTSGGLAGLSKTAAHEWSDVNCAALDLGEFTDAQSAAAAAADELLKSGPVERGLSASGTTALCLIDLPAAPTPDRYPLNSDDVVVITGGGRGVTAAAAQALSRACNPTLLLLGRTAMPKAEPDWLTGLSEEPKIKRAILENADGKLHPKDIEERYQQVVAGRELRETLDRIAAEGGRALYRTVDIRNSDEVAALFNEIRSTVGPISGIVHGAGVLADRLITDKSREQFASVYGTKVSGLRSLLEATSRDNLKVIALFSSTTGRFGRTGQVDYAVANEVLNKIAQDESRKRPECRTVSINWGPWDGGMVTPSLKKLFDGEGIGLIGLAEGGDFLVREIAAESAPVEIIALAENDHAPSEAVSQKTRSLTEALAINLNLGDYPFLRSHIIDNKAVLPMAVIAEWLAHAALHGNPGLRFHGFNDLRICKGVVLEKEKSCKLTVMAGKAEKRDSFYIVPVELTGVNGGGRSLLHARAEIILATRLPEGLPSIKEIPMTPYPHDSSQVYDSGRLFHGPDLHGIETVTGCSEKGIAAIARKAPNPGAWFKQPLRSSWLTDPLLLDTAFQMMILWSFERYGFGSLPCFAGRYRQYQDAFPKDGVMIVIRVTEERQNSAHANIEFLDRQSGKLVARLEDYECTIDASLGVAFSKNRPELSGTGAL